MAESLTAGSASTRYGAIVLARHGEPALSRKVLLSAREFALLEYLLRHPGQVLSRQQILDGVWGIAHDPRSNVVDVYVRYLRTKLGDADGTLMGALHIHDLTRAKVI